MGASASAHSDFISRFREYDDCLAAAKAKGKAFRLVKPHEVVTSPLLASQDLGRLKGSLMMVKASYSPVYGEWMAVLPSAVASATHIEVTLLGVHLGKQVMMGHEALAGLIIGVALGFLSDPASRRLDPFFRTHGEAAVPLVSSAISVSGGVPGAVLNDLPTRAYLEAPFQQLTLDAFVEGAQGSQRVVSTTHSVSSGLNHALPGQGPLEPRISPWLVSNEDDFAVRQQAASLKVTHLLGFPVALDIGRGGEVQGPSELPMAPFFGRLSEYLADCGVLADRSYLSAFAAGYFAAALGGEAGGVEDLWDISVGMALEAFPAYDRPSQVPVDKPGAPVSCTGPLTLALQDVLPHLPLRLSPWWEACTFEVKEAIRAGPDPASLPVGLSLFPGHAAQAGAAIRVRAGLVMDRRFSAPLPLPPSSARPEAPVPAHAVHPRPGAHTPAQPAPAQSALLQQQIAALQEQLSVAQAAHSAAHGPYALRYPPRGDAPLPSGRPTVSLLPDPVGSLLFVPFRPEGHDELTPAQVLASLEHELGGTVAASVAALNGGRELATALGLRPAGSVREIRRASIDLGDLLADAYRMLALATAVSFFGTSGAVSAALETLRAVPTTWAEGADKIESVCTLVERLRTMALNFTKTGGSLIAAKPTEVRSSSNTQGLARKMPKGTVPEARGAVAPALIDSLSSNEVIDAEAKVTPPADKLAAVARVVKEYGQPGFAVCFSNGKAKEAMDGAGTAVNVLNAHSGLVVEARALVRAVVGAGRDQGVGKAAVSAVAQLLVDATFTTGAKVHPRDSTWVIYPQLLSLITVLGGSEATDDYAPTADSLGAGCVGDPEVMADILEAVRALEDILVAIYHKGGLVSVNSSGSFGLYKMVKAASKILNVERTLQVLGRVMASFDEATDAIRTTDMGWDVGASALDIVDLVEQIRLKGLPAFNEDQRGEERASKNLQLHGLTPAVMARLVTLAASPAKTKWQQTTPQVQAASPAVVAQAPAQPATQSTKAKVAAAQIAGVTAAAKLASVVSVAPLAPVSILKRPAEGAHTLPPGFSMAKDFTDAQVAACRKLENAPGVAKGVCPWYNLFGYCRKSATDECDRCPTGLACTQAQLDAVRVTITHEAVAKVVITGPPVANPVPGDGTKKQAKRTSFSPKGDG